MSVLVLENFVFEEPDGSSGDTLVAAAVLGALVWYAGKSSWFFSVSV
jgi:hypothetical protein